MKKVLLISTLFSLVLAFSACKKSWDCNCEIIGLSYDTTLTDMPRSEAKAYCNEQDENAKGWGGSCDFK